jgi:hypothetical protein
MGIFNRLAFGAALFSMTVYAIACDDDPGSDAPTGGSGNNGGSAGSGNTGNSGGSGGSGGGPSEIVELSGAITADTDLTADKGYLLKGVVTVEDGATLTIEPGTVIFGEKASNGTLVIKQGAQIDAQGTADAPIVFTSELPTGQRAAGDWGGVVVLGRAPINEPGGSASVEGLTTDETYGGTVANDSSGTMRYVRIEFSGIEISPDNEINGLTLAGVGSGTTVEYIMVHHTLDDCFEFFGGTVNASHLVCAQNGDDGFDFDEGYVGNLQFLFLQQDPNIADSANGFECDNDGTVLDAMPITNPTIYNVTLCGQNADTASQQYGFLFRVGFNATIGNAIVTGFEGGVDFRDRPETDVTISDSIFFGNSPENIAYAEDGSNPDTEEDDDSGFDEVMWFTSSMGTAETDPMLADCFASVPDPRPASEIAGGTPPAGFDTSADYIGAFRDSSDDWMTGNWVSFAAN